MYDNWHRIESVVKWTGLSVNAFSRAIGLNRSENLYQIKRGNNGISRELAETICAKYPSVSKGWLLSGEGDMFTDNSRHPSTRVPYYNIDIKRLVTSTEFGHKDGDILLPIAPKCDFAANFIGESMKPSISSGSVVLCRRADVDHIEFGGLYMIVAKNFVGVRFLRSADDQNLVRAVPSNSTEFDTIIINKNNIEQLYRVVTVITNTL